MLVQSTRRRVFALFLGLTTGGLAEAAVRSPAPAPSAPLLEEAASRKCPTGYYWSKKKKRCIPQEPEQLEGCFLTTACCGEVGLADDCFELTTLRQFRDQALIKMSAGKDQVQQYYQLAPAILKRIPDSCRSRVLNILYARYIVPSVLWVKLGRYERARDVYVRGMTDLTKAFAPEFLPLAK